MKRRIIIIALGIVLFAAVWLLVPHRSASDGPEYQGKTARQWLGDVYQTNAAFAAFQEMGSNAVPFLVHEFQRTNSAWASFYARNYPKLPQLIRKHLSRPLSDHERWREVQLMLSLMPARSAIPDLTRLLAEGNVDNQTCVLLALMDSVSPEDTNCLPALINCLQSSNASVSKMSLLVLKRIGPDARAVPVLTNLMSSRYSGIREEALLYLRKIDPVLAEKYDKNGLKQPAATNSETELRGK